MVEVYKLIIRGVVEIEEIKSVDNDGAIDLILEKSKIKISTCNILGVQIAATNMEEIIRFVCSNIEFLSGYYICISNVHTTVMSYNNEVFCRTQNDSVFSLPDGKPLSIVCKRRGYKKTGRVTGPDFMGKLFELSEENKFRHFFYGSKQETLEALESHLKTIYPHLNIVGMYSPPFKPLTEEENILMIEKINAAKPDFVWVGLGAPKQEIWMSNNKYRVKGLMVGVGAGFDYYAGNIKRAPLWMQNMCIEWLYRLIQDPKRLWKRYMNTNWKFLWLVFVENIKMKHGGNRG
jgi:N-acetylglucosaminyldiphosphoundecaprenol N-acetyl-beta-D-mannosaminyltransferase